MTDHTENITYIFSSESLVTIKSIIDGLCFKDSKDIFQKAYEYLDKHQFDQDSLLVYIGDELEEKLEEYQWTYGEIQTILHFYDSNNRKSDYFAWWETDGVECDLIVTRNGEYSYLYLIPLYDNMEVAHYRYSCKTENEEKMIFALYAYFSSNKANKRREYCHAYFNPFGMWNRRKA